MNNICLVTRKGLVFLDYDAFTVKKIIRFVSQVRDMGLDSKKGTFVITLDGDQYEALDVWLAIGVSL